MPCFLMTSFLSYKGSKWSPSYNNFFIGWACRDENTFHWLSLHLFLSANFANLHFYAAFDLYTLKSLAVNFYYLSSNTNGHKNRY